MGKQKVTSSSFSLEAHQFLSLKIVVAISEINVYNIMFANYLPLYSSPLDCGVSGEAAMAVREEVSIASISIFILVRRSFFNDDTFRVLLV
jgi:hypothetical protein